METQNNPVKLSQSESNGASQKGNLYLIIAIIVGVFAIGAVGFVFGKYYSGSELEKNGNEIIKPLIEKETEKLEVADETANWKTFRSEKHGFEIKYPSDRLSQNSFVYHYDNGGEDENAIGFWKKGVEDMYVHFFLLDESYEKVIKTTYGTNEIIDGQNALTVRDEMEDGCRKMYVFKKDENSCLVIRTFWANDEKEKTINQMLSTFKFID